MCVPTCTCVPVRLGLLRGGDPRGVHPSETWFPQLDSDQSFSSSMFSGAPKSEFLKSPYYGMWAVCHFSFSELC